MQNECIHNFRESSLSPTEKNEIFNLVHTVLRLLLHIIQKTEQNKVSSMTCLLTVVKGQIQDLVFQSDVPMDTKSVCGILYLTIYELENGPDSWLDVSKYCYKFLSKYFSNQ